MAFNFNKLTVKAQETLQNAVEIAQSYNNQLVEPEHLFAAMMQDPSNIAISIIQKAGGNVSQFKIKTADVLERLPKVTGTGLGNQQLSLKTAKVLDAAVEETKHLKDEYVST